MTWHRTLGWSGVAALAAAVGCASGPLTGTPAASVEAEELEESLADSPMASVEAQVASGAGLFDQECDLCHGMKGQGKDGVIDAPQVIGRTALAQRLNRGAGYDTARGLFDFVSKQMPHDDPGDLTDAQYWDVVAYILYESEQPLQQPLSARNAHEVRIGEQSLAASFDLP